MNQIEITHGHGTKAIDVWPAGQKIETLVREPTILVTTFTDTADYHPALSEGILGQEGHPGYSHRLTMGGTKIKHLERWGLPAADLIHRRALTFFTQATGNPNPLIVDLVWANVSRQHEYLGPHSHTRAIGSIVYMVQPGDDVARLPAQWSPVLVRSAYRRLLPRRTGLYDQGISAAHAGGNDVALPFAARALRSPVSGRHPTHLYRLEHPLGKR
jgi:hypothetical protein